MPKVKMMVGNIHDHKFDRYYQLMKIDQNNHKYNQRQHVVGRVLLSQMTGIPFQDLINPRFLTFGSHRKPYLKHHQAFFNIAHSYDLVVAVMGQQAVGVDLEKKRPFDFMKIKRAFSKKEMAYLKQLPTDKQSEIALKLWTIKEGVLKLLGLGLPGRPKTVEVALSDFEHAYRNGLTYKIYSPNINPKYIGTIIEVI